MFGLVSAASTGIVIEHLLTSLPAASPASDLRQRLRLFLAFFLDYSRCVIIIPLLARVATKLGIDIIWFGVLLGANMQTSSCIPVRFALFYLRGVAPKEVKSSDNYWGAIPWVVLPRYVGIRFSSPSSVTSFVTRADRHAERSSCRWMRRRHDTGRRRQDRAGPRSRRPRKAIREGKYPREGEQKAPPQRGFFSAGAAYFLAGADAAGSSAGCTKVVKAVFGDAEPLVLLVAEFFQPDKCVSSAGSSPTARHTARMPPSSHASITGAEQAQIRSAAAMRFQRLGVFASCSRPAHVGLGARRFERRLKCFGSSAHFLSLMSSESSGPPSTSPGSKNWQPVEAELLVVVRADPLRRAMVPRRAG